MHYSAARFSTLTRYDRCARTFFSAICIAATVIFWINQRVLNLNCHRPLDRRRRQLDEHTGKQCQKFAPMPLSRRFVVDREIRHRPSVKRTGINLTTVINTGVAQRLF
jgi:hypothetical protein